jgi:hypothetical protein
MTNKPMFLFAGVYEKMADAEADYAAVKALHSAEITKASKHTTRRIEGGHEEAEHEALAIMVA